MNDQSTNPMVTAWCKLFHPRGPQVTLPLPCDPAAALAAVSAALDVGFLVQAPGLEEGEEKEQVGYVLKSILSNEGKETPFVLLYAANDALTWSFLKVYLNTDQDVVAFEYASKMKLAALPEYVGQDKPQRGTNHRTDTYIVPVPRPFGVVYKKNPKHDATEAGKMKPARLFVRWADAKPAAEVQDDSAPASAAEQDELDALVTEHNRLTGKTFNLSRMLHWLGAASMQALTKGQCKKGVAQVSKLVSDAKHQAQQRAGGAA